MKAPPVSRCATRGVPFSSTLTAGIKVAEEVVGSEGHDGRAIETHRRRALRAGVQPRQLRFRQRLGSREGCCFLVATQVQIRVKDHPGERRVATGIVCGQQQILRERVLEAPRQERG